MLREAGYKYKLDGVNIELSLAPKIIANFSGAGSVPYEKIERLPAENAEHSFTIQQVDLKKNKL